MFFTLLTVVSLFSAKLLYGAGTQNPSFTSSFVTSTDPSSNGAFILRDLPYYEIFKLEPPSVASEPNKLHRCSIVKSSLPTPVPQVKKNLNIQFSATIKANETEESYTHFVVYNEDFKPEEVNDETPYFLKFGPRWNNNETEIEVLYRTVCPKSNSVTVLRFAKPVKKNITDDQPHKFQLYLKNDRITILVDGCKIAKEKINLKDRAQWAIIMGGCEANATEDAVNEAAKDATAPAEEEKKEEKKEEVSTQVEEPPKADNAEQNKEEAATAENATATAPATNETAPADNSTAVDPKAAKKAAKAAEKAKKAAEKAKKKAEKAAAKAKKAAEKAAAKAKKAAEKAAAKAKKAALKNTTGICFCKLNITGYGFEVKRGADEVVLDPEWYVFTSRAGGWAAYRGFERRRINERRIRKLQNHTAFQERCQEYLKNITEIKAQIDELKLKIAELKKNVKADVNATASDLLNKTLEEINSTEAILNKSLEVKNELEKKINQSAELKKVLKEVKQAYRYLMYNHYAVEAYTAGEKAALYTVIFTTILIIAVIVPIVLYTNCCKKEVCVAKCNSARAFFANLYRKICPGKTPAGAALATSAANIRPTNRSPFVGAPQSRPTSSAPRPTARSPFVAGNTVAAPEAFSGIQQPAPTEPAKARKTTRGKR